MAGFRPVENHEDEAHALPLLDSGEAPAPRRSTAPRAAGEDPTVTPAVCRPGKVSRHTGTHKPDTVHASPNHPLHVVSPFVPAMEKTQPSSHSPERPAARDQLRGARTSTRARGAETHPAALYSW